MPWIILWLDPESVPSVFQLEQNPQKLNSRCHYVAGCETNLTHGVCPV